MHYTKVMSFQRVRPKIDNRRVIKPMGRDNKDVRGDEMMSAGRKMMAVRDDEEVKKDM